MEQNPRFLGRFLGPASLHDVGDDDDSDDQREGKEREWRFVNAPALSLDMPACRLGGWVGGGRLFLYLIIILGRGSEAIA